MCLTTFGRQTANLRPETDRTHNSTEPPEQPRLDVSPHMLSMNQSEQAEVDHVPRRAVFILHQIQGHGHVGVTVVTAQVVL